MTYSSPVASAEAPFISTPGGNEPTEDELKVADKIAFLAAQHARGEEITPTMITDGLTPDHWANARLRTYCLKSLSIKAADFDRAMHQHKIKHTLGYIPASVTDYVEREAARLKMTVHFNGSMSAITKPMLYDRTDASSMVIEEGELQHLDAWNKRLVNTHRNRRVRLHDWKQDLRVQCQNLGLRFAKDAINDAAEAWFREQKDARLYLVRADVSEGLLTIEREQDKASLIAVCRAAFAETEEPEYVAAVIQKFVWQVKRKMFGLPITNHLMPVLLGPQGKGKSTFLWQMLAPVDEVVSPTTFSQLTDERNIDLLNNYVLVFDEMSGATKADLEVVKNAITASVMARRPMTTNLNVTVPQNATLIGSSNALSVGDLIRDPTGLRRFAGLVFSDDPDYAVINGHDWMMTWRAVDMDGPDPMDAFMATLRKRQEEHREKSRVEDWLADFTPSQPSYKSNDLYLLYQTWESTYAASGRGLTATAWATEMSRIERDGTPVFRKRRGRDANFWDAVEAPQVNPGKAKVLQMRDRLAALKAQGDRT